MPLIAAILVASSLIASEAPDILGQGQWGLITGDLSAASIAEAKSCQGPSIGFTFGEHEARVVHTVADSGGWMQLSSGEANVGEQAVGRADARVRAEVSQSLQPAGAPQAAGAVPVVGSASVVQGDVNGRELSGWSLSAAPREGAASGAGPTLTTALSGAPSSAAVEAARQRGPRMAANPLDTIKSRVAEQLGQPAPSGDAAARSAVPVSVVAAPVGNAAVAPVASAAPALAQPPKVANGPSVFPVKVEE